MKLSKIIYYIFLACLSFIALLLIISTFPIMGNYKLLVVQSGSMEPAIKTGSVVFIKPSNNYKRGDIITFFSDKKAKLPTTHRIVDVQTEKGGTIYTTKGDANDAPDSREIRNSEVLGKVLFSAPYLGYGVAAAKTASGFIAIIIIPAVIIIFDEAKKIWREIRKIKEKKYKNKQEACQNN